MFESKIKQFFSVVGNFLGLTEKQIVGLTEIYHICFESEPIKCVPVGNRFLKVPDGWVQDAQNGIAWGPSSEKRINFEDAQKFCADKGGRLPTLKELHSLVDYEKKEPAIDKEFFADTHTDDWYWSATPIAGASSSVWCVGVFGGFVLNNVKVNVSYVRPVRASQ